MALLNAGAEALGPNATLTASASALPPHVGVATLLGTSSSTFVGRVGAIGAGGSGVVGATLGSAGSAVPTTSRSAALLGASGLAATGFVSTAPAAGSAALGAVQAAAARAVADLAANATLSGSSALTCAGSSDTLGMGGGTGLSSTLGVAGQQVGDVTGTATLAGVSSASMQGGFSGLIAYGQAGVGSAGELLGYIAQAVAGAIGLVIETALNATGSSSVVHRDAPPVGVTGTVAATGQDVSHVYGTALLAGDSTAEAHDTSSAFETSAHTGLMGGIGGFGSSTGIFHGGALLEAAGALQTSGTAAVYEALPGPTGLTGAFAVVGQEVADVFGTATLSGTSAAFQYGSSAIPGTARIVGGGLVEALGEINEFLVAGESHLVIQTEMAVAGQRLYASSAPLLAVSLFNYSQAETTQFPAAAPLTAVSSLGVDGRATKYHAAALESSSSLSTGATRVTPGATALQAVSSLSAPGDRFPPAHLAATSVLNPGVPKETVRSAVAAQAQATLTVLARLAIASACSMLSYSSLAASPAERLQGVTPLLGQATLGAGAKLWIPSAAPLVGSGSFMARADAVYFQQLALTAESTFVAGGTADRRGIVGLLGAATLQVGERVTTVTGVGLLGVATLVVPGKLATLALAPLTATATLAVPGLLLQQSLAHLVATTSLDSSGSKLITIDAVPTMVARGGLIVDGDTAELWLGHSFLEGQAQLGVGVTLRIEASVELASTTTLNWDARVFGLRSAELLAGSDFTAGAEPVAKAGVSELQAASVFGASAQLTYVSGAPLTAVALLNAGARAGAPVVGLLALLAEASLAASGAPGRLGGAAFSSTSKLETGGAVSPLISQQAELEASSALGAGGRVSEKVPGLDLTAVATFLVAAVVPQFAQVALGAEASFDVVGTAARIAGAMLEAISLLTLDGGVRLPVLEVEFGLPFFAGLTGPVGLAMVLSLALGWTTSTPEVDDLPPATEGYDAELLVEAAGAAPRISYAADLPRSSYTAGEPRLDLQAAEPNNAELVEDARPKYASQLAFV